MYITTLIIALIPEWEETAELLGILRTNAGISGLALLITAVEQTFTRSITLYHAIVIFQMISFLGIGVLGPS